MSYKQPGYLKQIWWTIKWFFIRNKKEKKPKTEDVRFSHPPMDLRMK